MEKTKVVFRNVKYPDGAREILALFPEQPEGRRLVSCYAQIGQHGTADYQHIIRISKPAAPEEYGPLKKELESLGYNLEVRKKHSFYKR